MLIQNNTAKPKIAIFLDIDGVLGSNTFDLHAMHQFNQKVKELCGNNFHTLSCKGCMSCSIAQAHLFKKEAVEALHHLISQVNAIANVHIIISSTWRIKRTLEDLKYLFQMHAFSDSIFDKTIENDKLPFHEWTRHCVLPHIETTPENYLQHCKNVGVLPSDEERHLFLDENWECRASQIKRWIKEHPEYAGFVIFDDLDEHLSVNFGEKFISTNHPDAEILKPEDAEKGYRILREQLLIKQ